MADWRQSRGHLLFLREFLKPLNIDGLPTGFGGIDWELILGEEPKTAIQRFLDTGVLVSASLSEHVDRKFKVTDLEDMLRSRGLSPSRRNKQDLILQLIQTNPDDMKQAVKDLTVVKCSGQGEKIVEHFLTTVGEPPVRDDMLPADRAKKVAEWILEETGAGAIGGATYDALKKLAEANVSSAGLFSELPKSFHNPHEYNAEYILISGGRYRYSVTWRTEFVPDMYFARYPVTHKRYLRFIRYLDNQEPEIGRILPADRFYDLLPKFTSSVKGFADYLGSNRTGWADKFRCRTDEDRRFGGEDQPVVRVSWFSARAYCLWLTELTRAGANSSANQASNIFRLPKETEWEWAASGGKREYPWGDLKPSDRLANYGNTVGATTPVGSYPDGATPEGLMDMAGNAWEWMENWHEKEGRDRSLRGGSWSNPGDWLRCSARGWNDPSNRGVLIGFRVVRSQS